MERILVQYTMQNLVFAPAWIDGFFVALLLYFIVTSQGLIHTVVETVSFLIALVAGYRFYPLVGRGIASYLSMPNGISQAIGFFATWFFIELVVSLLGTYLAHRYFKKYLRSRTNQLLGYALGAVRGALLFLFFVSLAFALPVRGQLKQAILDSRSGPPFVRLASAVEGQIKNVFNDAIQESLNFLTIKPGSSANYDLGFEAAVKQLTADPQSETEMLALVNKERAAQGAGSLTIDPRLTAVARAYATEMFENGFFSHESQVDGSTPAERVERAGIEYEVVGENLAFAPDVYIAHQGLMNSEGHRKNILFPDFGHVGIGVIDGGVYGRMFVQVFKD